MKYKDRHKRRSTLLQPVDGEDWRQRHARRLELNLSEEVAVRAWSEENKVALTIANEGHHWQFRHASWRADWWPSSAKLVLNQQWRHGIHIHDYITLIKELEKWNQKNRQ